MPASSHRATALNPGLLIGGLVVLLGGLGATVHPTLPHGEHPGGTTCSVCLHLAGNPAAAVTAPEPAVPAAGTFSPPPTATLRGHRRSAPGTGRAPPAFAVS